MNLAEACENYELALAVEDEARQALALAEARTREAKIHYLILRRGGRITSANSAEVPYPIPLAQMVITNTADQQTPVNFNLGPSLCPRCGSETMRSYTRTQCLRCPWREER